MNKAKPFSIAKKEVWQAYRRVRSNQGSAGVDGQTIEGFEKDLSNNLYKLWNRMSSGSYFPPPVRRVEIPKLAIGFGPWGYQRYQIVWHRWLSSNVLNQSLSRIFIQIRMDIDRGNQRLMRWVQHEEDVGDTAGRLTWISKVSLTT